MLLSFCVIKGCFTGWLVGKAGFSMLERPFFTLGILTIPVLLDVGMLLSVLTVNN